MQINFVLACLKQLYENVYYVDIIYLILYYINNYWYNLLDLTSRHVYENNGYALIRGYMRRLYYTMGGVG